jgi:hypothetical protein
MLDEDEWACFDAALPHGTHSRGHSISLQTLFAPALGEYERLTGIKETNINAALHHRVSLHGPPCKQCGKPLRTDRASFCAACGSKIAS